MITFTVNGQRRETDSPPDRPLLDVLREDLQLTGTKYGCGEGQCRACTVLVDGKPQITCVTPVSDAAGKNITTIEGLADGEKLNPVQQVFMERNAFQCGYCTSGMICGLVGVLNEKVDDAAIMAEMNRHVCRCCGYDAIAEAIKDAAAKVKGGAK